MEIYHFKTKLFLPAWPQKHTSFYLPVWHSRTFLKHLQSQSRLPSFTALMLLKLLHQLPKQSNYEAVQGFHTLALCSIYLKSKNCQEAETHAEKIHSPRKQRRKNVLLLFQWRYADPAESSPSWEDYSSVFPGISTAALMQTGKGQRESEWARNANAWKGFEANLEL